jgi:hypothetical protein
VFGQKPWDNTSIRSMIGVVYEKAFCARNEHPEQVLWEQTVEGSYKRTYSLTRIVNATVVVYNPTSENATLNYEVTLTSSLAPENNVQKIAYWIAPIGIVIALPWIVTVWIQRTHK